MATITVGMTMNAESAAAEATVLDAAIVRPLPVRSRPSRRAAIAGPHETHRYRADRGGAHQSQDDTARTFHGTTCPFWKRPFLNSDMPPGNRQAKGEAFHGIVRRRWFRPQPPPEKCAPMACANKPKPPRVTPPEPDSDDALPAGERLDEESPPKKLAR